MSALTAAQVLEQAGFTVRLLEKSRGPGGRMASRQENGYIFDYGAQYFTARDPRLVKQIEVWTDAGLVRPWEGRIGVLKEGCFQAQQEAIERFVGVPKMSAIARHMAKSLNVVYETRIERLESREGKWCLSNAADIFECDAVIISTPPRQALDLIPTDSVLQPQIASTHLLPCWALMAAFDKPLALPFDGAFVEASPLAWIARNNSKADRATPECWVLHGSSQWSTAQLETKSVHIEEQMLAAFFSAIACPPVVPTFTKAHRWRYSKAAVPLAQGYFWDDVQRLGICGDWCNKSRVEGAFLSGIGVAERIIAAFST